MKPHYLLIPVVIFLLLSACHKSTPGPVPAITPTKAPDSVTHTPLTTFPYTDTFAGNMVITYADQNGGYTDTMLNYKYCVKHINEGLIAFCESSMFPVDGHGGSRFKVMNAWDTCILNASGSYYGEMYIYNGFPIRKEPLITNPTSYSFQLTGTALTVHWDDEYVVIPACDYGRSVGQFNGVLLQ
jgi:hypothetical protein